MAEMDCKLILVDPSCRDCAWKGAILVPPPPVLAAGDPNALFPPGGA